MYKRLLLLLIVVCAVYGQVETSSDEIWLSLMTRVQTLYEKGNYNTASQTVQEALREAERLGGVVRMSFTLNYVGLVSAGLGRTADSERAYRRAISLLGDEPDKQPLLAHLLTNLATLYTDYSRRYRDAERLMARAVELSEALLQPDDPELGVRLSNLATAHLMQGHEAEATKYYKKAHFILAKSPITYQFQTAVALSNFGVLLFRQGDTSGALDQMLRSVSLAEQMLGPNHPELIRPLLVIGQVYLLTNRPALAEEPLRRVVSLAESLSSEHPIWSEILPSYLEVLRKTAHKKEANQFEARARALGISTKPPATIDFSALLPAEGRRRH